MAIVKTQFRNDDLALQAPEVLAWLQANATEYFNSITYDSNNSKIVCEIGETKALEVFFTGTTAFTAYLNNGVSFSGMRGATPGLFLTGVVCSNGICLNYYNTSPATSNERARYNDVIITKDNNGDVTFVSFHQETTGTGAGMHFTSGTFTNFAFNDWYGGFSPADAIASGKNMGIQTTLSSLIPMVDKTYPIYTPNCYRLYFNQYFGTEGQFTIDGTNYYTTGFVAIAD